MKKMILLPLLLGLVACDDAGAANDAAKPSSSAEATSTAKPADPPAASTAMGHDEVLKKGSALEGKPVIVEAVSWGVSQRTDGVQVNLGPEKLSGMRQSKLVAFFPKGPEQKRFEAMKDALKKDAEVTLACTGGKKAYGTRRLLACKLP